jgi:hypothetical protein
MNTSGDGARYSKAGQKVRLYDKMTKYEDKPTHSLTPSSSSTV